MKMEQFPMNVMLDNGALLPMRAHPTDAGIDLCAVEGAIIPPHGSAVFDTGVHVQLPPHTCGMLVSKSGLNVKYDLTSTGLIDEGYTGSIRVKLYNHGEDIYAVQAGEKISQLVILPVYKVEAIKVDRIDGGERGDSGFGSSGRF